MNVPAGIVIAMSAGIMNGFFPLPMKANNSWEWENNWLPFSALSLCLFPVLIAWAMMPHLGAFYAHVDIQDMAAAVFCGALVFTGSLLFGISIVRIGVSLSFALVMGTMNAVGVLTPRLIMHRSLYNSSGDRFVLGGVLLSLLSVVLGFLAGKSKGMASTRITSAASRNVTGCLLAIAGGVLSGFLPASMVMLWAQHLTASAKLYGNASGAAASIAVLAFVLVGGAIPNCGYSTYLLWRNKSYRKYRQNSRPLFWALVVCMGGLYAASVALWGTAISPSFLGALGPSVGWALFVGMIVITSTAAGLVTGEWKHSQRSVFVTLPASLLVLVFSMILIGWGNYLS